MPVFSVRAHATNTLIIRAKSEEDAVDEAIQQFRATEPIIEVEEESSDLYIEVDLLEEEEEE